MQQQTCFFPSFCRSHLFSSGAPLDQRIFCPPSHPGGLRISWTRKSVRNSTGPLRTCGNFDDSTLVNLKLLVMHKNIWKNEGTALTQLDFARNIWISVFSLVEPRCFFFWFSLGTLPSWHPPQFLSFEGTWAWPVDFMNRLGGGFRWA